MSEYIPLEIQEEILKKLPLKPLIQFRSVSKPWKALIDNPEFIVSYGVHHPHPDRFILRYQLSSYSDYPLEEKCITLVDDDDDHHHSLVQQEFIPTVPDLIKNLEPRSMRVIGSSRGVLCFHGCFPEYFDDDIFNYDGPEMVILWNPAIRKSIGIQVPYIYDSWNEDFGGVGFENVVGSGVCPVTLDPTILKIKCIRDEWKMKDMHDVSVPNWKVRVFTLSTRTWSILSTNLPRGSIKLRGDQVVVDKFIYWVGFDRLDAEDGQSQLHVLIMSFNLTTKEFKEINLSDSLSNEFCIIFSLSKLKESLVLLAYDREFEEDLPVCSLWMMKEQGLNRSFTKLYNINMPDASIRRLLGFRKSGEPILETYKQYPQLESYDPNSEDIVNLGIVGEGYSFFMCSYMETLLLVDQLEGFIYIVTDHK